MGNAAYSITVKLEQRSYANLFSCRYFLEVFVNAFVSAINNQYPGGGLGGIARKRFITC